MAKGLQKHSSKFGGKGLELTILVLASAVFGYAFTMLPKTTTAETSEPEVMEAPGSGSAQTFSKFTHDNAMHARLPCLLCHKRAEGLTTPKFPGHTPCDGCHVQQFADNKSPICVICHTATGVKPFPALASFNVRFDHGKHIQQTKCATCHKPSRRGVALSVPSGANGHITCFQCHGPRTEVAGRNIGSCGECHQPGRPVKGSEWAKAFTVNFSHQEHIQKGNMNCAECHTVRPGASRGRQVSSPLASMHFARAGVQSCAACHNNKRAFGTNDFTNCKQCHEGKTFRF